MKANVISAILAAILAATPGFAQATPSVGPPFESAVSGVAVTPVPSMRSEQFDAGPAVRWPDPALLSLYETDLDVSIRVARLASESRAELARDFAPEPVVSRPGPDSGPAVDPRDAYSTLTKVVYHISWPAEVATGLIDLGTTHRNLKVGFVEGNALLVREDGGFAYSRKVAATAGVPLGAHHWLWKRGRPVQAIGANVFATVVNSVAAAHNERLFRTVTPDGRPIARRTARFTYRF